MLHPVADLYGDDVLDRLRPDDLTAFKVWMKEQPSQKWSWLLCAAVETDACDIAEYCAREGGTVCECAVSRMMNSDRERMHRRLVEIGALSIHYYVQYHGTMLGWTVQEGKLDWAQFCLSHGADPSKWEEYQTPLAQAAETGNQAMVELLLLHEAWMKDSGALCFAAEAGQKEMVQFLLAKGFDINELGVAHPFDDRTWVDMGTPLHKAIEQNHVAVAEILIGAGADLSVVDGKDRTPMVLATELGREDMVKLLQTELDKTTPG